MAITPAMREGSGMVEFHRKYPNRFFDVGIAEQHAVTLAAGMACEDTHPVVAIYSTFLQRAYDQVIHDVALQDLPVLFAIDRAGLVGPDGPTHAGSFDLSFLRCIPNMVIMAPSDENECRQMLYTGFLHEGPAAVRYPRGAGPGAKIEQEMTAIPLGQSRTLRNGTGIAILAFGSMVEPSKKAAEEFNATLIDMRFVKPLDEEAIRSAVERHDSLVTVEENAVAGGAGGAVNELICAMGLMVPMLNIGLQDTYIQHGTRTECLQQAGLDAIGIQQQITRFISAKGGGTPPLSSIRHGTS
jgi:1-deoxy-D-xylulose-5-phosphate synthase